MTTSAHSSTRLFFTEGGSDKVYQAQVMPKDSGFVVEFQYGRRGAALKAGTKTEQPVSLESALKIYDKLVKEKTSKGYTEDSAGTTYQGSALEERVSGYLPQLLNPIGEDTLDEYLQSDDWFAQEKFDGERRMLIKEGDDIKGVNKKGLVTPLPMNIVLAASTLKGVNFALDCEIIGERLYAFDILRLSAHDTLGELDYKSEIRFEDRLLRLERFFEVYQKLHDERQSDKSLSRSIVAVHTARTPQEKRSLLRMIREANFEGVVFKHRHSLYKHGYGSLKENAKDPGLAPQLKFRLLESATVEVSAHNEGKRSVAISGVKEGANSLTRVPLGNVTIPANFKIPQVGEIVEVQYLYANPQGALQQPVYLGPRSDQDLADCVISKLKYKGLQPDLAAEENEAQASPRPRVKG